MICDVLSSFLLFDVGLQGAFGAFSRFCSRKPTAISCRLFAIVWYCLNHIWHLIRWKWWYMMVATARLRSILVGMSEMLIDCVFTGWCFQTSIFHVPSILASRRSSLVGMQRRDEALENVQKALEEQSEAMRRGGAMALDGNGSSTREIYTISTISTTGIGGMFFRISYTMDLVPCLWT